jgi:glucosamine-6-phosphate deaminase
MSTIESSAARHAAAHRNGEPAAAPSSMHSSGPRIEKIPCRIYRHAGEASKAVAAEIAALIRQRAENGQHCVLGLATGSTPVGVYGELVRLHQEEGLSFRHVVTFNLDEYFPMQPDELQSYVRFMREHLFDHVDILPENVHIPDGTLPEAEVEESCRRY